MLAMAVVNHKGGGGGLGRKCVEEEDDILTTLRRLRQTLQECHGRVGLMDQRVEALQPHYKKTSTENDINFRRNNFHTDSFVNYVIEDQCHTQPCKIPTNHMMNGMTNKMDGNVGTMALTNGGGLLLNYHEIMNKGNLYMNDLVQSPSQNLSALELDLMTLAEKHAKELCDMYCSQSNATSGQNGKKLDQELVTLNSENKKTYYSEEVLRENGQVQWEKNPNGGFLQIPNSHGDSPPSINGKKLPEEKKTRRFSKCKEWWSDRLNNMKIPGEDLYENGIEANGNEEDSPEEIPKGEVSSTTVNNEFFEQDYFKSYTVSNQDIPKVYRRGKRMLMRTRSIDLEDLPEECETSDLIISESIEDRGKECCDDMLPVAHEMAMDRNKECCNSTIPVVHEMEIDRITEGCEDTLPDVHEMEIDSITECCEDTLLVSDEMVMDRFEECYDNTLLVHEMGMDRTKEYCEDRVTNVHEMVINRIAELPDSHEMGMDRNQECLENTSPVVNEMVMDRVEKCFEDTLPVLRELEVETLTDNEQILSVDKRLLTNIKVNEETKSTEDAVNTSAKVTSNVPVHKIQSSLDVVEKSLDDFKKSISELHVNLKQMSSSEELNLSPCIVPNLRNTNEDSEIKLNPDEASFKSSDTSCSEHNSKICLCNRKRSYGNKLKGHSCTAEQKILGISDESQRHYKIRGKHNFVVKLSRQRGSEADTVPANRHKLIHHSQYKDSQGWLYKFITFVVFMMLLFFVFYIILTVPIITLSVKHNGGPVPF
ncbi:uncharacterized protein [Palaemon carinicauda]|uniref:uncharacterized protein n=1 Tax=Palaemon carinicauda TaxID=392227 RepID=UPI0035B6938E